MYLISNPFLKCTSVNYCDWNKKICESHNKDQSHCQIISISSLWIYKQCNKHIKISFFYYLELHILTRHQKYNYSFEMSDPALALTAWLFSLSKCYSLVTSFFILLWFTYLSVPVCSPSLSAFPLLWLLPRPNVPHLCLLVFPVYICSPVSLCPLLVCCAPLSLAYQTFPRVFLASVWFFGLFLNQAFTWISDNLFADRRPLPRFLTQILPSCSAAWSELKTFNSTHRYGVLCSLPFLLCWTWL